MKVDVKGEKGAITMIVLVAMLFLISILMSIYVGVTNKAQASAETTKQIIEKYNNLDQVEEMYASYFADEDIIPIYTKEQLEKIGSGQQIEINGKIYIFAPNAVYTLQNDIDLGGYNDTSKTWVQENAWTPLTDSFTGILDGLGHKITGLYINDETASNQGLFGILKGTVKNLSIEDSYINVNSSVGAIAGRNEGTVQACKSYATILANDEFGALVGTNEGELKVRAIENYVIYSDYFIDTTSKVLTVNARYFDSEKVAAVPKGFKIIEGINGEKSIDEGLVIETADGNSQFVWIPINDVNDMFMCQEEDGTKSCRIILKNGEAYCNTHKSIAMAGRLYATTSGEFWSPSLTTQVYSANSGLREPAIVTGSDGISYDGAQYSNPSDFLSTLQTEYNGYVKSVINNGGFYVGRYETSGMADGETITIKAGETPSSKLTWYTMYDNQKAYITSLGHLGGMINGAAHDQVLKFVNTDDYIVSTAGNVEHNFSSIYASGSQITDQSKNLYDLEGNLREWTTEASFSDDRVSMGTHFDTTGSASLVYYLYPTYLYSRIMGSRCVLYVN